jgi:hypothetical protein
MSAYAVVVLFIPAWKAALSSTPRSTCMSPAPMRAISSAMRAGRASAMRRFVARLLERVIIRRTSSSIGTAWPTCW